MSKFLQTIRTVFKNRPVLSNAIIYGGLYFGAEWSQQMISRKLMANTPQKLDIPCLQRFAIYGTLIQGPLLTVWYRWLDARYTSTAYKVVIKKVLIDQFLLTPHIVYLFFITMSIMEGKKDIFEECKHKYLTTFQSSCLFWLPTQTINFLLIPAAFRVVYVGVCSFAWVNIMCYIKRKAYKVSTEEPVELEGSNIQVAKSY